MLGMQVWSKVGDLRTHMMQRRSSLDRICLAALLVVMSCYYRASQVAQCKESAFQAGHVGTIPGLGKSPKEGNGNPLYYSCLENPMDRGAWRDTINGVAELDTTEWLSTSYFCTGKRPLSIEALFKFGKPQVHSPESGKNYSKVTSLCIRQALYKAISESAFLGSGVCRLNSWGNCLLLTMILNLALGQCM